MMYIQYFATYSLGTFYVSVTAGIIAHEDTDFLLFTAVPSRIVAGTGQMLY